MLLLATQAEPQMLAFEHPNLGRLVQRRHFPKVAETAARGVPWSAIAALFVGCASDQEKLGERVRDPATPPRAAGGSR